MSTEHVFLTRVRLRARRTVSWFREQWVNDTSKVAIGDDEVDRILAEPTAREKARAKVLAPSDLTAQIEKADLATVKHERLARVRAVFGLSSYEIDLLTLAVATELDPWMRRAVGYLHDDVTAGLPSLWLAREMFDWPLDAVLGPGSPLATWKLAQPIEGHRWSTTNGWSADPFIASWLVGAKHIDPSVADVVRPIAAPAVCAYPKQLDEMASHVNAVRASRSRSPEIVLVGDRGSGKRSLAAQLCERLKMPLLAVDAARLTSPELAIRVVRLCRLLDAAVFWHDADQLSAPVAQAISNHRLISIAGTTGADPRPVDDTTLRRMVRLPSLTRTGRVAIWTELAPKTKVPDAIAQWSLLPADIARAASVAGAGDAAVLDACRAALPIEAASLVTTLERPYKPEALVLAPGVRTHLDELLAQARLRTSVYEDWGYGQLCPNGSGITALFAGPSGTGKTMAAQVLARELDMDLYRVDLAGVVSKYIGETEKHLKRLFDACERLNVVLFFDEADALFGQRMQVKEAHDRFANIEIDYLLQRMEQFQGIAILATNRRSDLDTAFVRRMRFIVEFLAPGVEERRLLWESALIANAPDGRKLLHEGVDIDALATRLELTGAEIKNASLAAAFLARSKNESIAMSHIMDAVHRELAKQGVVMRGGAFGS